MQLEAAIRDKSARIGVIGLGYVGLPLIRAFIAAGYRTLGFDVDQTKVDRLLKGQSYIAHLPGEWIARCVAEKQFEPTSDMRRLAEADCILICVPTPLSESRDPDLSYVENTARQIAATLRPGQLIVLESTTYPGTTRDVMLPILEAGGLKAGRDFYLAYSPEREDPGNAKFEASVIPKVVGGLDPVSLNLAAQLYGQAVVKVVPVSSCEVAEACKRLRKALSPGIELGAVRSPGPNGKVKRQLALLWDADPVGAGEPVGIGAKRNGAVRIGGHLQPDEHGIILLVDIVHEVRDLEAPGHRIA